MINALMTGVYNEIKADVALMALIGGTAGNGYKTYHIVAPREIAGTEITPPYLTFGTISDAPMGTFASVEAMEDATFYVNVWSDSGSAKETGTIVSSLDDVLNDAALTVVGFTCMKCVRKYLGSILYDEITQRWLLPTRYRVWLDKN